MCKSEIAGEWIFLRVVSYFIYQDKIWANSYIKVFTLFDNLILVLYTRRRINLCKKKQTRGSVLKNERTVFPWPLISPLPPFLQGSSGSTLFVPRWIPTSLTLKKNVVAIPNNFRENSLLRFTPGPPCMSSVIYYQCARKYALLVIDFHDDKRLFRENIL